MKTREIPHKPIARVSDDMQYSKEQSRKVLVSYCSFRDSLHVPNTIIDL